MTEWLSLWRFMGSVIRGAALPEMRSRSSCLIASPSCVPRFPSSLVPMVVGAPGVSGRWLSLVAVAGSVLQGLAAAWAERLC